MPSYFPLYAITTASEPSESESIRNVNEWLTGKLEDGSVALLVFTSQEKAVKAAKVAKATERTKLAVVTIESAYKLEATLKNLQGDGQPTKVCWNESDGKYDKLLPIPVVLDWLAKLPGESKGS